MQEAETQKGKGPETGRGYNWFSQLKPNRWHKQHQKKKKNSKKSPNSTGLWAEEKKSGKKGDRIDTFNEAIGGEDL